MYIIHRIFIFVMISVTVIIPDRWAAGIYLQENITLNGRVYFNQIFHKSVLNIFYCISDISVFISALTQYKHDNCGGGVHDIKSHVRCILTQYNHDNCGGGVCEVWGMNHCLLSQPEHTAGELMNVPSNCHPPPQTARLTPPPRTATRPELIMDSSC